jgi:hypothetical protein
LIDAARVLGFAGSSAAVLAVLAAYRPTSLVSTLPALAGGFAIALSGPVAAWSIGGLEQPLLAALLAWGLVRCYPLLEGDSEAGATEWVIPGVMLSLLCWTRADGALFTAATCIGLVAGRGVNAASLKLCARVAALPMLAFLGQLGFRLAYYGEWVPNSALAKVAFTESRLSDGLAYLAGGLWALRALVLLSVAFALLSARDETASKRVRFLSSPLLIWSTYVVLIGGDIFPAWPHLVPIIVILALLLGQSLENFARRGAKARLLSWVTVPALLAVLAVDQQADPENHRARTERWEWGCMVMAKMLRSAFAEQQPLLAATAAGCFPYFSGLPAIDMLGINDHFLARNRPADFGYGWQGHELGNGRYILEREPDLIIFCGPRGAQRACYRSGKELLREPGFRQQYRLVTFEALEPWRRVARIWVRAEGGRIGIAREAQRVVVPAFFMMDTGRCAARLEREGQLCIEVAPGTPAALSGLVLGPGFWRARLDFQGPPVEVRILQAGTRRQMASGTSEVSFVLGEGARNEIDVVVSSGRRASPTRLYRIVFEGPVRP